jgi:hypothetical protein
MAPEAENGQIFGEFVPKIAVGNVVHLKPVIFTAYLAMITRTLKSQFALLLPSA